MPINRLAAIVVAALALLGANNPTIAQERLPDAIRSNSVLSGQIFGCTVRLQRYFTHTVEQARLNGRNLPPHYQVNFIAGLDIAALEADARLAAEFHLAGTVPILDFETMIQGMADVEYDATSAGAPGYHEAWGQAAACGNLFHEFGLYDIYR